MYACCVYTRHDEADVFIKLNQKPNPKLPNYSIYYNIYKQQILNGFSFFMGENFYSQISFVCLAFIFIKKNLVVKIVIACILNFLYCNSVYFSQDPNTLITYNRYISSG